MAGRARDNRTARMARFMVMSPLLDDVADVIGAATVRTGGTLWVQAGIWGTVTTVVRREPAIGTRHRVLLGMVVTDLPTLTGLVVVFLVIQAGHWIVAGATMKFRPIRT
jgi:hypothetical protein